MSLSSSSSSSKESPLLYVGSEEDREYLGQLKSILGSASCFLWLKPATTLTEVRLCCESRKVRGVLFSRQDLLLKLAGEERAKIDDYAGSLWHMHGIEWLCVFPLVRMIQQNYIPHLQRRFISKLTAPEEWQEVPSFRYTLVTEVNAELVLSTLQRAILVGVDIETSQQPYIHIQCIAYTALLAGPDGSLYTQSFCLPIDSMWAVAWMRKYNWEVQAPKTLQNGKYDCAYLFYYNAPLYNWCFDTATMFHCWYAELPKDLGALAAYGIRSIQFWKNKGSTGNLADRYEYNALDTHWTLLVTVWWLGAAPEWARQNFLQEFPLLFPCHVCEMTGIKRDMKQLEIENAKAKAIIEGKYRSLRTMVGDERFNSNSPVQTKTLLKILGIKDPDSSDEKHLKAAAYLHPLNARVLSLIIDIREARKLLSTYLGVGTNDKGVSLSKEFRGRILSAFNPHGTDTGRLASREHHFWTGLQLQNIPVEDGTEGKPSVKATLVADDGFALGECDLKQAESRDTGYIIGSETLIAAVTGTRDFHSVNASAFFGRAYETIFDDAKGKTKDKPLRNLSKRTNHGANYNMGPGVLVDTMGLEAIYEAKKLLQLKGYMTPRQIAEELLARFDKTYPELKGVYQPWLIKEVLVKRMLVGATGWTRYCFGNPQKNKSDLNAYVAHCPQSLNAMKLNKGFMRVFYEIWLPHHENFKLLAQIHDSIFFQFRKGHEYLAARVAECMQVPCTVTGLDGKTRTYTVPADVKVGVDGMGAHRWSETE